MGKTIRKTSGDVRKARRQMLVTSKKKGGMSVDEYLRKLRIQNLNSGDSEW